MQQPREDHGITDVRYLKFIKAQHLCLGADLPADAPQRIFFLFQPPQPIVNLEHEAVKVHPAPSLCGKRFQQGIHHQGFAPAYRSPKIKACYRIAWVFAKPLQGDQTPQSPGGRFGQALVETPGEFGASVERTLLMVVRFGAAATESPSKVLVKGVGIHHSQERRLSATAIPSASAHR